jgi:hypothetical protein
MYDVVVGAPPFIAVAQPNAWRAQMQCYATAAATQRVRAVAL